MGSSRWKTRVFVILIILVGRVEGASKPAFIEPCPEGPALFEARQLVDALNQAIGQKDLEKMRATWKKMHAHACFELAFRENRVRTLVDEVEVMAAWWERGGHEWLVGALEPSGAQTVLAPDMPRRVVLEKAPGLARLACQAEAPLTCGAESAGWAWRVALPTYSK